MTNRRSFLSSLVGLVAGGAAAAVITTGQVQAESVSACECSPWLVESLAREITTETGEWKEAILRTRDKSKPMVVTRYGCCGCEINLPIGAHHPDWTYTARSLTAQERSTFKREYGNMAGYLLHSGPSDGRFEYRGFILNGRREGWNVSIRSLDRSTLLRQQILASVEQDIRNNGSIREALTNSL
jgi:hypothetical protein